MKTTRREIASVFGACVAAMFGKQQRGLSRKPSPTYLSFSVSRDSPFLRSQYLPSGDIDMGFNPESFIANLAKANKARKDFEAGIEGAGPRLSASLEKLGRDMAAQASRAENARVSFTQRLNPTAL